MELVDWSLTAKKNVPQKGHHSFFTSLKLSRRDSSNVTDVFMGGAGMEVLATELLNYVKINNIVLLKKNRHTHTHTLGLRS